MRELLLAGAVSAILLGAASIPAAPAMQAVHTVAIKGFAFAPKSLTVTVGESVRFVNADQEAHTVVADNGAFHSGGLDTNDSWSVRMQKPGKYPYFCSLHPYMKGTIVVLARGGH
jgi:plastocyanin